MSFPFPLCCRIFLLLTLPWRLATAADDYDYEGGGQPSSSSSTSRIPERYFQGQISPPGFYRIVLTDFELIDEAADTLAGEDKLFNKCVNMIRKKEFFEEMDRLMVLEGGQQTMATKRVNMFQRIAFEMRDPSMGQCFKHFHTMRTGEDGKFSVYYEQDGKDGKQMESSGWWWDFINRVQSCYSPRDKSKERNIGQQPLFINILPLDRHGLPMNATTALGERCKWAVQTVLAVADGEDFRRTFISRRIRQENGRIVGKWPTLEYHDKGERSRVIWKTMRNWFTMRKETASRPEDQFFLVAYLRLLRSQLDEAAKGRERAIETMALLRTMGDGLEMWLSEHREQWLRRVQQQALIHAMAGVCQLVVGSNEGGRGGMADGPAGSGRTTHAKWDSICEAVNLLVADGRRDGHGNKEG